MDAGEADLRAHHPKISGPIPYDRLPKAAKMMLKYCGVDYNPDIHSPSTDKHDTPHWLTDEAQDRTMVHIYDLDGKVTENFILMRSLGMITNMIPEDPEDVRRCEELETEMFYLMNRMTWMINKVCYDPENVVSFDLNYAQNRYSRRLLRELPKVNAMIMSERKRAGDLICGPNPCYADFLTYACLYDLKQFVPRCFAGINNKPVTLFFRAMESLPELKEWFEGEGAEGEYIRPPKPSVTIRIGYFA